MGNWTFNVVVTLFWLATMGWLVVAKILPPLRVGEPPNYTAILDDAGDDPPSCWTIQMHGRTIGWAANKLVRRKEGVSEFYSWVYLGELPLDEMAPGWMSSVLKPVFSDLKRLDVEKQSRFVVDPLGRLSDFESRVRLGGLPDAIRVQGRVDGSTLNLSVKSGDISATMQRSMPPQALLGDELSPQTRMPNLRVGQTWTLPVYSPFRSPHRPMEILQATVEQIVRLNIGNTKVATRLVVYRGDAGSGPGGDEIRGRMWVREDGVVLRQEVSVFQSPVRFDRVEPASAKRLWQALPENWNRPLPGDLSRRLLDQLRTAAATTPPDESDLPQEAEPLAAPAP